MDITVLNEFRPWSKKILTDKYKENRRHISKRLQNKHKTYFKDFITEELIMNVMHPRNIGRLWDFEDFY